MSADAFSKKRFSNWAVLILVGLNILVIGTFWWTHFRRPRLHLPEPAGPNEVALEMPDAFPFIARELHLTRTQMRQVREMREKTLPEIRDKWFEMHQLRKKVHDNLFEEDIDANELRDWTLRIGQLQSELEWTKYEHLIALKDICSPRQQERLQNLIDAVMQKYTPPGRGRRGGGGGPGPGRGFGQRGGGSRPQGPGGPGGPGGRGLRGPMRPRPGQGPDNSPPSSED